MLQIKMHSKSIEKCLDLYDKVFNARWLLTCFLMASSNDIKTSELSEVPNEQKNNH